MQRDWFAGQHLKNVITTLCDYVLANTLGLVRTLLIQSPRLSSVNHTIALSKLLPKWNWNPASQTWPVNGIQGTSSDIRSVMESPDFTTPARNATLHKNPESGKHNLCRSLCCHVLKIRNSTVRVSPRHTVHIPISQNQKLGGSC